MLKNQICVTNSKILYEILNEIKKKRPKFFLEVGVFHGVTARNVCELLYQIHKNEFKSILKKSEYPLAVAIIPSPPR